MNQPGIVLHTASSVKEKMKTFRFVYRLDFWIKPVVVPDLCR